MTVSDAAVNLQRMCPVSKDLGFSMHFVTFAVNNNDH